MVYTDTKKICWNCQGELYAQQRKCPYCGASSDEYAKKNSNEMDLEKSLASLYKPPYAIRERESNWEERFQEPEERTAAPKEEPLARQQSSKEFFPILLLSLGGLLLSLSLLIFFFSEGGVLTLQWKAKYWFIYLLLSLPVLSLGWKGLKKIS